MTSVNSAKPAYTANEPDLKRAGLIACPLTIIMPLQSQPLGSVGHVGPAKQPQAQDAGAGHQNKQQHADGRSKAELEEQDTLAEDLQGQDRSRHAGSALGQAVDQVKAAERPDQPEEDHRDRQRHDQWDGDPPKAVPGTGAVDLSLIHISEPTRLGMISYAVFCLKK